MAKRLSWSPSELKEEHELGAEHGQQEADVSSHFFALQPTPFHSNDSFYLLSSQTPIAAYITFITGALFLYFISADRSWLIGHTAQSWRLLRRALLPYCMVLAGILTSYSLLQAHIVISAAKGKEWAPRVPKCVTWSFLVTIPIYTVVVVVSWSRFALSKASTLTLDLPQILAVRLHFA